MRSTALIFLFIFANLTAASASNEQGMPVPPSASPEFERIKALAGVWEGTTETEGKTEPAKVEYSVTSGGTAVVEKLFPGTSHEMVSVYHDENNKLTMTHFCMLAAKPKLDLKSADEKNIVLDYSPSNKIDEKSMHMHGLTLSFPAAGELEQAWTCFNGGSQTHTTLIHLKKVA